MLPRATRGQQTERRSLEVSARKTVQTTAAKQQQAPRRPPSSLAPYLHQSLQVKNLNVHYSDGAPDNNRILALTSEIRDAKRGFNASSSSANILGGRQRERHIGPWLLGHARYRRNRSSAQGSTRRHRSTSGSQDCKQKKCD